MGSEACGHQRQLNNAGKLHQEQSRNLQARARLHLLSGATMHVYCVLPQITRTRTLCLCRHVYRRQGVGPDRNTCSGSSARCHQPMWKRVVPFCSSKVGAISLFIEHEMRTASVCILPSCWMTISIPALLSISQQPRSDPQADASHAMRTIPWGDWGPAAMRVLFNTHGVRQPKLAGPFWITGSSPFMIRDYDVLRTR